MNLLTFIFREEQALENNQEGKNNHLTMSLHTSAVTFFTKLLRFISERALAVPQLPRRHYSPHTTRSHAGYHSPASLGGKKHVLMQDQGLAEVKSVAMDTRFGLQRDGG